MEGKNPVVSTPPMLTSLSEKGQGMVEYALILILVAVVVIAALTILGPIVRRIHW